MSALQKFLLSSKNDHRDEFEMAFQDVVNLGITFKVSEHVLSDNLEAIPKEIAFDRMPETGLSCKDLLDLFSDIARNSSNWASPNFMGFPDAANGIPGLAAALLIPFLNQNMANQEICSPRATFIEMEVIHWLREALGYSVPTTYSTAGDIGGIQTLGGCLSNTIALLAAREKIFPGSGYDGIPVVPSKIRVLVPDVIEHYSIRSAMAWLSLGEQNVIRIPIDGNFLTDKEALKRIIKQERDQGNHLAYVAYAGDSRGMRIDDLDGLSEILEQNNIWFHVDACHGSQLIFSERHRDKLGRIERADSITIDPHKTMLVPYNCSFVLFKDPSTHAATSTSSDLILNTQWSLGRISPFIGSKAFDALKMWSTIKFFGTEGLGRLVDERLEPTASIQSEIARRPNIVLLNNTDINSCMMMFIPRQTQAQCMRSNTKISDSDLEKLNRLNWQIKEAIRQDGSFYVHGFPLKSCLHEQLLEPGKQVYILRTMNGNPSSTIDNVVALLDRVEEIGQQLLTQAQYKFLDSVSVLRRLESKLDRRVRSIFGETTYVAVIYGSSVLQNNTLLSDIDLMIFAEVSKPALSKPLEVMFRQRMEEEGITIDAEVPFERKLLVPMQLAFTAAKSGPILDSSGNVPSILKTSQYLLKRLIFNVLTTPNKILSSTGNAIHAFRQLEHDAGETLFNLLQRISPGKIETCDDFVRFATSEGSRSGEEYLGYKQRADVIEKLGRIFTRSTKAEAECLQ
ncbi:L-2,4-diaminobutyrate decarboxylase [Paramyrothecium foliicola]|nr:L-2,4-diaminobutyrate decarboxylase [Paramyrothecium foliicola]